MKISGSLALVTGGQLEMATSYFGTLSMGRAFAPPLEQFWDAAVASR
ncbi:MAG TPA: hypothetical protein VHW06_20890 [Streptosporangiaceae bacterium]|jgi:hypothetical protein|nr:hypothetical protein [Streptosporangiaceae bacterium]